MAWGTHSEKLPRLRGSSKTTIHRAVKSGKLSASRTEDGGWLIDPAELSPAYPGTGNGTVPMERSVTAERPDVERDSPLGRPPHCEPDLLPEGQFERVAVGVGDPRNIADKFAGCAAMASLLGVTSTPRHLKATASVSSIESAPHTVGLSAVARFSFLWVSDTHDARFPSGKPPGRIPCRCSHSRNVSSVPAENKRRPR